MINACSYGCHAMEYIRDKTGKIIWSRCAECGAEYQGFHA